MKILQISSAQSLGGGERHLADLADGLAQRGHELFVAARPRSPLLNELKHVQTESVFHLALRNALDAHSARQLHKIVRQHQIQIVHAHMERDYPLAAYAARRQPQARLIVTRHVLFPLNRLDRVTLAKAARIIAVSNAVAAQLRYDGVSSADKISVVFNGIDVQRFAQSRQEFTRGLFLEDWNLPPDALLVGTIGELIPRKGQLEFLQAAARVVREIPEAYFVIAGVDHSPQKHNLRSIEKLISELELTDRVTLIGWTPRLADLYCGLDVFVSASHTESFGLAIAEAMASGTAVIATRTEGAQEIIQTEANGVMVPISAVEELAVAVSGLLKDKKRRQHMANSGQKAVQRFNLSRMIDETERVYAAALNA